MEISETMAIDDESSRNPTRLEGKLSAKMVCWILGFGSLVAWNIIPTIGDYYYQLFPVRIHPLSLSYLHIESPNLFMSGFTDECWFLFSH